MEAQIFLTHRPDWPKVLKEPFEVSSDVGCAIAVAIERELAVLCLAQPQPPSLFATIRGPFHLHPSPTRTKTRPNFVVLEYLGIDSAILNKTVRVALPHLMSQSAKDKRLSRQLIAYVMVNSNANTFYWCQADINAFDLEEPPNTHERAEKVLAILHANAAELQRKDKYIVDWDGTLLPQ